MGNSAARDTREADTQIKRDEALRLRREGKTYHEICAALGCAVSMAHKYVREAIEQIPRENAEAVLKLELERIDNMFDAVFPKAKTGDYQAIASCIRLMERRAKYLGLDAPEKREITGKDGGAIEVAPGASDELLSKLDSIAARVRASSSDPKSQPS